MRLLLVSLMFFGISARALDFDDQVPNALRQQIQSDLDFMYSIENSSSSKLHREIFGDGGQAYKNFFEARVTGVGLKDCGGNGAVACVIPYLEPNKMWISPVYSQFSHPQIARLMVVFHEARHTERKEWNWSHAKCPIPFLDDLGKDIVSIWSGTKLAGEKACDSTAIGAYGMSVVLLKNIARFCKNCSEKVKVDAEIYGTDQISRLISDEAKKAVRED